MDALAGLARRNWRADVRSSRLLLVLVLAAALFYTGRNTTINAATTVMNAFTTAMIIVPLAAAGAIARDYSTGAMMLDRLHGAKPLEIVLAALCFPFVTSVAVFSVGVTMTMLIAGFSADAQTWALIGAAVLGILGSCAFIVALGPLLPGTGNGVIGIALFFIFAVAGKGGPTGFDFASLLRALREIIPGVHQVEQFGLALQVGRSNIDPVLILAGGTVASFIVTVVVVHMRDPAWGWRR